jgi:TRAP-type C4-dicarboxylate transport system permease small subunit
VKKFIHLLERTLSAAMALCLALMVCMVFGNVVLRYGFNSSIVVSEELSRWLFVWMIFLGAVVGLINASHLGTDALLSRLGPTGRKLCFGVAHGLMLLMCWFMFRGALEQTRINMQSSSAVMEVSMAWLYASGLVFSILASVVIAYDLWRLLRGSLGDDELVQISSSDDVHPSAHSATSAREQA